MTQDSNLLVGFETSDDAGVYKLNDEMAIVVSADFITPPFDDPHLYGEIAAANALSDIYAMGARPLTCLSLVGFPTEKLSLDILQGIMQGASTKIVEAGAVLAGGHSVDDLEPKFGLAVTGIVHPDKIWTNAGAKPGDHLVLTKPVGSGVILNANLKGWVSAPDLEACTAHLRALNRDAAEAASGFEIHAATDITGFGLACHALEMAEASNVALTIQIDDIPVMDGALAMYRRGMSTGSNESNRETAGERISIERDLPVWHENLLFDPQTNGGLLFALPAAQSEPLLEALSERGLTGHVIGTAQPHDPASAGAPRSISFV